MHNQINSILKTKKIIFLDFDGVVNNIYSNVGSYITHPPETYGVSDSNLKILKKILVDEDAYVVISSNWRKFEKDGYWIHDGKKYYNPLPKLVNMLGTRVVGYLPKIRHVTKSVALQVFFEDLNIDPNLCHYAILDDDLEENFQTSMFKDHFYRTNPDVGLSKQDIKPVVDILNY